MTEIPVSSIPTETLVIPSATPIVTKTPEPTVMPTKGSRIISKEILNCTTLGTFVKCNDKTLGIEFEYPVVWGEIEAVLRTGGDSEYVYKYYFNDATITETYLPYTGGVSLDFAEGREWAPTDFAGFGDKRFQVNSCENSDLYPVCNEVINNVRWMIRFPNAKYLCENAHFYIDPIFRIEVNLPLSNHVNGFVFEVPFLSENQLEAAKRDVYSTFLVQTEFFSFPESCDLSNRQAFDERAVTFVERLSTNSVDIETQINLDDLMHLVESIIINE